ARVEIGKIRNGEESIFRKYASVDEDEFFAVCMEVYFEQPHQLFEENPELYKTLSNLLHQDTIRLYDKLSA
ncbi:MAG: zinc-dependent peptidase, partial [Cyclobacteriaceae bacterium]|nr:zinc-dependent peptidase [Cyclobacteriaceae bacterium]